MKKAPKNLFLIFLPCLLAVVLLPFVGLQWQHIVFLIIVSSLLIQADRKRVLTTEDRSTQATFNLIQHNLYLRKLWAWHPSSLKFILPATFHPVEYRQTGYIRLPELNLEHRFTYTTDSSGYRITSRRLEGANLPKIAIFGCSLTWGHGLSDEETFCWKLQEAFPEYQILNVGVTGFSAYETNILLEAVVAKEKPEIAIIAHHSCTDERSLGAYPGAAWYRGPRCISLKLPWSSRRRLIQLPTRTLPWYMDKIKVPAFSALSFAFLSCPYLIRNNDTFARDTTKHLLLKSRLACQRQGTSLIVLTLECAQIYGRFLSENNFEWCSFDVDTQKPEDARRYTLAPFDCHYNGTAATEIVRILAQAIESRRKGRRCQGMLLASEHSAADYRRYLYPMF